MTPLLAQAAGLAGEVRDWRHRLHAAPELAFVEHATADFVAAKLTEFGLEVHRGLAGTGVVAVLRAGPGPAVGLRADMDALPIEERTGLSYASRHPGRMHACGHDGHTAMLLGAAKLLAAHPPAGGTVVFIFQPAEENEGGGRAMVEDGLFERFPVDAVFGLHNWPGLAVGRMAVRPGPMMAALDTFEITLEGVGCHAAMPHLGIDPVTAAGGLITGLQSIVSRNVPPAEAAVVSVTQVSAGEGWNTIPARVLLRGTVRSLTPEVQDLAERRLRGLVAGVAAGHGVAATVDYQRRYPPTINTAAETALAQAAAATVVGADGIDTTLPASMGAEDFAFLLWARPGCYAWLGNGPAENGKALHAPTYDFNDDAAVYGIAYWVSLARMVAGG